MIKKKLMSVSLAAAMAASLFSGVAVQAETYFADVTEDHWAYEWVDFMAENGYIHAYPDGNYKPGQNITRAEFVTILNYIFKSQGTTNYVYSDVHEGDWFYGYIHAAVKNGFLHGYDDANDIDDGTMKPNNYITREEAAVIVADAFGFDPNEDVSKYVDGDQVSWWAVPYVGAMTEHQLLMGDLDLNTFRPKDNMLRAEAATMLGKAAQALIDIDVEKAELPALLKVENGVYKLDGIQTRLIAEGTLLAVDLEVAAEGNVGNYKVSATINGEVFAEGVTLEELIAKLNSKSFTAAELEGLSISFSDFESPEDSAKLVVTVKVRDAETGEKVYDTQSYTITFSADDDVIWPVAAENGTNSYKLSGFTTQYTKDMILDVAGTTSGSVGTYTINATLNGTTIVSGVTAEELKTKLAEQKLTAAELATLVLTVDASNPANGSKLILDLKLKDAETDTLFSQHTYTFEFTRTGGSGGFSGGGKTITDVDSSRDRVVQSLTDYQSGTNNSSSTKAIVSDFTNHGVSTDMLLVILTNDGMNTFDPDAVQPKDASKVDTVWATMATNLNNSIGGNSCFASLYPIYEDVIKYVLDNTPAYKSETITTATKEKYVHMFRAMVQTINGSAAAAIKVYNENPTKTVDERFDLFKLEAASNTLDALDDHINGLAERDTIRDLAIAYCQELFDARNDAGSTLKADLAAAGTLDLNNFSTILKKFAL